MEEEAQPQTVEDNTLQTDHNNIETTSCNNIKTNVWLGAILPLYFCPNQFVFCVWVWVLGVKELVLIASITFQN